MQKARKTSQMNPERVNSYAPVCMARNLDPEDLRFACFSHFSPVTDEHLCQIFLTYRTKPTHSGLCLFFFISFQSRQAMPILIAQSIHLTQHVQDDHHYPYLDLI